MRSAIRVSALLLLLGGCLGLVTAHHRAAAVDETIGLGTSYAEIIDDYDREMDATGSISLAAAPRLSLSDEERGLIFLGVINLPNIPELAMHAPETGVPLPKTVELHEIPAMVVRRIPELNGYTFVKLDDRILVVSAETRQVEAMIPRYKLVFH
ncbi:MAG: DUF1236 domain-containing protein [Xanthobacteraceae bacterium]|nr:DUF1236 domain-containing protein [Xanthobacteraceae bacterium]